MEVSVITTSSFAASVACALCALLVHLGPSAHRNDSPRAGSPCSESMCTIGLFALWQSFLFYRKHAFDIKRHEWESRIGGRVKDSIWQQNKTMTLQRVKGVKKIGMYQIQNNS